MILSTCLLLAWTVVSLPPAPAPIVGGAVQETVAVGEPFTLLATHDGLDTTAYLFLDGSTTVATVPVSALVNNAVGYRFTSGLPAGSHPLTVVAVGPGGNAPSAPLMVTAAGSQPIPPGPQGAPVIARAGPAFLPIRINFQPSASAPVPGWLPDIGLVYGDRGNGQTYGWTVDNSAQARIRNSPLSPDPQYDRLTHLQLGTLPAAVWELALPSGTYRVRIVSGDPIYFFPNSTHKVSAEGVVVVDGITTTAAIWLDATATVTVTDGRLTVREAPGGVNSKVCFLEVTKQ